MNVLIVEDDPPLTEYLQAVLRRALESASVAAVSDLESALERTGHGKVPDLVLLDLGLPGCAGLEALLRFRSKFPLVPVAVVSATEDRRTINAALQAGAVGYIPKSTRLEVMIAAISRIAGGGTYIPPE